MLHHLPFALPRAGAARSVSRRYIADFVAKRNRTAASAAFVGSSAVGMAAGAVLRFQKTVCRAA